ncbi:MAG: hypothetical protein J6N92_00360 [Alloprevotella sp.]|nr:hypothetical protein [Alloprevotella sp.]
MAYYGNILEEELKNKVAEDFFSMFDTTQIVGRIDFCVCLPPDPVGLNEPEPLLWAEAKSGTRHDIYESFIQLILTLGKERPQDHVLPPSFLGAFDAEKIAFLPYNAVLDVLRQNDFNWNVAPSNHTTKEFLQLKTLLESALHLGLEIYYYERDAKELLYFIRHNFALRKLGVRHIRINRNNFTHIYLKWLEAVKPTININWEAAKKAGILDADFYLADILSKENKTLGEKLFVLLQDDHYLLDRRVDDLGLENYTRAQFTDHQEAHHRFWNRYARPPRREYWDDIVGRRDLLVPQDVRKRKGSFFTPSRWVELSQQYIAAELGEDWQEHYYVWDCCAGTGNLLAGLTNKYNIYASTLDRADVQAMHQRIAAGANLLPAHVFQFDFLNDPFFDETDEQGNVVIKSKLPQTLQDIIRDPEKRKRLVVYINPPYAEAGTATQVTGSGENKKGVSNNTAVWERYRKNLGLGIRELYVQFFARVYDEIPTCILAEFSTLKILQGTAFLDFRNFFRAKLGRNFCVPANTFDNVKGHFPIGFFIWHTNGNEVFTKTYTDVYKADGEFLRKKIITNEGSVSITKWITLWMQNSDEPILGFSGNNGPDFQNNQYLFISSEQVLLKGKRPNNQTKYTLRRHNLIPACIYFAVRLHQPATWLNDRDQFLYPTDGWQTDWEFQTDCLAFTLFHGQNRISSAHGTNHWIPFTEEEVGAQERFDSHFMSELLRKPLAMHRVKSEMDDLFDAKEADDTLAIPTPLEAMSQEAHAVLQAGRDLWQYYHKQKHANPNASFYDIRLHFQGTKTTASGKEQMNPDSTDTEYTRLITALRQQLKVLAQKIEPKVYQYGFLKQ